MFLLHTPKRKLNLFFLHIFALFIFVKIIKTWLFVAFLLSDY